MPHHSLARYVTNKNKILKYRILFYAKYFLKSLSLVFQIIFNTAIVIDFVSSFCVVFIPVASIFWEFSQVLELHRSAGFED